MWKIPAPMKAISQKRSASTMIETDLVIWIILRNFSRANYWGHPTSRCAWHLYGNPHMCMIIIQWASHLSATCQPKCKLGAFAKNTISLFTVSMMFWYFHITKGKTSEIGNFLCCHQWDFTQCQATATTSIINYNALSSGYLSTMKCLYSQHGHGCLT
jgi:hypothetical protein